ncbi:hypothetical protein GCT13_23270 [Paraburkholderia sp. CNPSo 3157]|uniref:Uncharacterized protein n=1 Tax=Paraburkholderia franconis TaxID=2654983 RepID=A0A7X1THM7_9BURK|nr:hypothetical protein [Paraburkholderia franconis]MPW19737.1 hypothetical protein [Paraburkholderia franconis]
MRRRSAERFVPRLFERGWLPLLSWHQIAELMQHGNDGLVDMRLRYLRGWPMAAWVKGGVPNVIPGSELDVLRAEVRAAYTRPELDVLGVRDIARSDLLSYGTGLEAVPDSLSNWRILRLFLAEHQAHAQKVAVISPWRAIEIENTRIADWLDKPHRDNEATAATLVKVRAHLKKEIVERGDKRIASPAHMAADFMSDVAANVELAISEGLSEPLPVRILLRAGLEPDEINFAATFRETMAMVMFRQRLRMASDAENLPWEEVKEIVTPDRVPSAFTHECMRTYAHDQPERKGSDVNDLSLLCLAPYATETFVDKRTLESVRRAKQKVPRLAELLGSVRKAASYHDITAACPQR